MKQAFTSFLISLAVSLTGLASSSVWALPEDRDRPIQVNAASMQWLNEQQKGVYQGEVVATQGELRLEADRLTLFRGQAGTLSRVLAENEQGLAYMRDLPEQDQPQVEAWAERIDYNPTDETLILTGQAHLVQGEDSFRGHQLTYHLTTQDLQAKQDQGSEQRIEVILSPQRTSD